MTAGTIFDRTRTPLTVWFTACWLFATQKDGSSAQSLQRSLEIGSYPTAWAMLHRLRSVLVRPGRDRLSGTVEVDETFMGGQEPGLRGGRAKGKKVLTGIAVEAGAPRWIGRCRMAVLADASAESLNPFITGAVEPGSTSVGSARLTCGQPSSQTPFAQVSPKREDVTDRVLAGQRYCSSFCGSTWEPLRATGCRPPVWLRQSAAATAKTASTSITGRTAGQRPSQDLSRPLARGGLVRFRRGRQAVTTGRMTDCS